MLVYSDSPYAVESDILLSLKENHWVTLAYNKIPANKVVFVNDMLTVKVEHSAGPIVHKLGTVSKVVAFSIKGKVSGSKITESGPFDEDSVLRFGLVGIGKQTLSGPKKWFAAEWVKKLFALAPPGMGLDKITFFNLTNREELLGKTRVHPKSKLIVESIFANTTNDEGFEVSRKIEPAIEAAAVWISIDGDDTKSKFETTITEIRLKVAQ